MDHFAAEVLAIGQRLHGSAVGHQPQLYRGLTGVLVRRAMVDARLRDGLFQLVDVLPQMRDSQDIATHLQAYLAHLPPTDSIAWLLRQGARPSLAWVVRRFIRRLARQFLIEEHASSLERVIREMAHLPAHITLDAVGEAVLTEPEADAYAQRNMALLGMMAKFARPNLSVKLTGLSAQFDPLDPAGTRQRVWSRLAPLLEAAQRHQASVTIDMEQHELKPLILDLFLDMVADFPGNWQPAIALQSYLSETGQDLERILAAAQKTGRRLGVRLVKGAYWDQEMAWAAQRNWPVPTLTSKADTDVQYEALTGWLMERSDALHPAIASHNLRSQSVALAHAARLHLPMDGSRWEAQMLLGMAEPLRHALAQAGTPLRIYVPTGDMETGIAYLIRRLLENTASTSVLRQTYVDGADVQTLMAPPVANGAAAAPAAAPASFVNQPLLDFSLAHEREAFAQALGVVRHSLPRQHGLSPAFAPGVQWHEASNPARPHEGLGRVELAGSAHVPAAIAVAQRASPAWAQTPVAERIRIVRKAASMMVERRCELAALLVLEVAKPWREADGDVAEAIDFLNYYAIAMQSLAGRRTTIDFPGETHSFGYWPRGLAVVIAPWNFPLAILAGMTVAALITGNTVIMKPALPALLVAHELLGILHQAGVPPDAVQCLAGEADLGAALVAHPAVHVVAFTGSRAVGVEILRSAHQMGPGQRHVKQVVCEMGGKNAIVVDTDADLDAAVAGILASAFGYSGQKCSACSRVIAVDAIHDRLLARLSEAAAALRWGPPEDPACEHGPLITAAARDKALSYIAVGRAEGRCVWQGRVPESGWYVPPSIFADILPTHRLAREEVFGPVLAVLRAPDFVTALHMVNDCDYALTGGVYSRLPAHLELAQQQLRVGNLYLNRKITGAQVGVQPFGGIALSGTGVQTGGPDYLKQFLWSQSVSNNTMRRGMPLEPS